MAKKVDIHDFEIRINKTTRGKMLAQVEVIYNGVLEMKGWRIMLSDRKHLRFHENIWITPPCYRSGNEFKPIVYIADKKLYQKVEDKIYEQYHLKTLESQTDEKVSEPEGSIPF